MITDIEDINFFGSNIPKEVECIINQVNISVDMSFDNDEQRKAYHFGIKNTLSVLQSLLDDSLRDNCLIFYYPKTQTCEEMSIEEIVEWLKTLEQ